MPCYEPSATATQQRTALTLELLAYVREKLRLKLAIRYMPPGVVKFKDDERVLTKEDADYATAELCGVLRKLQERDREAFEMLAYDAHDKTSRKLADWWESHQEFDKSEGR